MVSQEHRYELDLLAESGGLQEAAVVECRRCGTMTIGNPDSLKQTKPRDLRHPINACPACGGFELLRRQERILRPFAFLPFRISRSQALSRIEKWRGWSPLAPKAVLEGLADESNLRALLVPYWIFDCTVTARYKGGDMRSLGTGQDSVGDGDEGVSGTFRRRFTDIVVSASKSIAPSHLRHLIPTDPEEFETCRDDLLEGVQIERYHRDWKEAFESVIRDTENPVREDVYSALGGHDRHIESLDCRYHDIAFKVILLPIWIFAFHAKDQGFRLLIDAHSGHVDGELPRSKGKTVALIAAVALIPTAAAAAFFWFS